jgi:Tfp pilus assembly protein PilX
VDRQGLLTLIAVITLLSLGIWRHLTVTEEISRLQRDIYNERLAREVAVRALENQQAALSKRLLEQDARTSEELGGLKKQVEAGISVANRSQAVLDVLYVIRYGSDGKPDAIAPRNDESGIGLRR